MNPILLLLLILLLILFLILIFILFLIFRYTPERSIEIASVRVVPTCSLR
jgi:hypothetical protein